MGKVVRAVVGVGLVIAGAVTGNFALVAAGVSLVSGSLFPPKLPKRAAAAAQLQLGEQPRQAIFGRAAVAGSLVDAFNYGGDYGTDWEVLVIALADHRCDALEGFFVDDTYVAFTGDGTVPGFNSQLQVFFRSGTWDQTVPSILTTHGPGWTANDRGRGVCHVVVAYKGDAPDAKNPVYPSGRPRFRWVVRGLRCYQARKDSTVGGSGTHRRDDPATWEWTENPIDIRHNWVRGIYAGDRVTEPGMLLVGRGLSAIEAPPANVFARANLCDELVGGSPRYRIGGLVSSNEPFIDVETDFAAACAGVISQPEGAVEVDPGQAKAAVAHFTDADLLVGSTTRWSDFLGQQDEAWVNTVAARFTDPGQRWAVRGAPVRRDLADVVADGGPREAQPQLDFVTNAAQAQRVAEIIRRLGRLWGRGTVTLPPRFAFIEEGDWVTWQSNRYFGGATRTFRVEAWGSNAAWHHQISLRQISASVFSDTAPLDDGVVATNQDPPLPLAAPASGDWTVTAVSLAGGDIVTPAARFAGAVSDPAASEVVFEFVRQTAVPDALTQWTFASSAGREATRFDLPLVPAATVYLAVSYMVDGILGPRRVFGPLVAGDLAYPDGTPIADLRPAQPGADVSLFLSGPKSATFTYTSTGVLDPSAQMPAPLTFLLSNQSGVITSGVTWFYRVVNGIVNEFAPSTTNRSMTVNAGVGNLTVNSLGSNSAQVEVFATFGGGTVSDVLTLTKLFAAPNTGGGGSGSAATASQTSGFSNVTSTSFATVSNELQVTSGTTTQTVDVQLSFAPFGTTEASTTIEVQVERWNGSAWVAMGAAVTAESDQFFDSRINNYRRFPAVFNFQRTATITAGTNQRTRIRARRTSGTINHSTSGTLTLSA